MGCGELAHRPSQVCGDPAEAPHLLRGKVVLGAKSLGKARRRAPLGGGSQHPPPDWAAQTAGQLLQKRSGPDTPNPQGPGPGLQAGPTDRGPTLCPQTLQELGGGPHPSTRWPVPPPAQSSPPPRTAERVAGGSSTSAGPSRVSRHGCPLGLGPGGPSDRQELLSPTLVHRDSANPGRPPDSQGGAGKGPEAPPPPGGAGKPWAASGDPCPCCALAHPLPETCPSFRHLTPGPPYQSPTRGGPLAALSGPLCPSPKQPLCCSEITG